MSNHENPSHPFTDHHTAWHYGIVVIRVDWFSNSFKVFLVKNKHLHWRLVSCAEGVRVVWRWILPRYRFRTVCSQMDTWWEVSSQRMRRSESSPETSSTEYNSSNFLYWVCPPQFSSHILRLFRTFYLLTRVCKKMLKPLSL